MIDLHLSAFAPRWRFLYVVRIDAYPYTTPIVLFSAFYAESSTALKISFQQKATLNLSFKVAFLSGGFNSDIFASEALHCNGLQISSKNTRDFFEVLLTQFEPPVRI